MNVNPIRILLIDGNPIHSYYEKLLCKESGIAIQAFDHLSNAIEYLSSGQTDIVLLHLGLMDSLEMDALHSLADAAPNVPIVVLAEQDDEGIRQKAIEWGAQEYLIESIVPGPKLVRILRCTIERKRAEASLHESEESIRQKSNSAFSSEADLVFLDLNDLIDLGTTQNLLEDFYKLVQIPMGIIDLNGTKLIDIGSQDICNKFYRTHPESNRNCIESNSELTEDIDPMGFRMAKCKNNLWKVAMPIAVGKRILGYIFMGPFFFEDESPDYDRLRFHVQRYDFAESEYKTALRFVPRANREAVQACIAFLAKLTRMISRLSYNNILFAKSLEERNRLMDSLHTSETRLSNAMKTALLGHWDYDIESDLFTFSDHFYSIMKTTAEREGGYLMSSKQYINRFIHLDDRSAVIAAFKKNLESGNPNSLRESEHRIVYPDGKFGYILVRLFGVTDDRGRLIKTYGVNQDITARKLMEEALEKSEAQYRLISENATDVIWLHDFVLDRFIYISPSVERIWGFSVEEALSHRLRDFATPESGRTLQAALSKRLAVFKAGDDSARVQIFEFELLRNDGIIVPVETVTTLIVDDSGTVVQMQGISRDISERKLLQRQLLQAQKMEAIGRLAGGVAHDFNNILTVILGYSNSLLNKLPATDPARESLETIKRSGNRAAALTSKLLAFSRKQIMQPKIMDLKTLIQDSLKIARRIIGEDIELVTHIAPDLGLVKADSTQIEQVIMNLAVNSRDAMPRGGTLTLECVNADLKEITNFEEGKDAESNYIMLSISDTGTGMDQETKSHLFEPFFTTKSMGKGSGLGLATVYGIIKQSGGFIKIDSELGKGTSFKIFLPRVDGTDEQAHSGEIIPPKISETILLVEDSDDVRTLILRYLKEMGYSVLTAIDGPSAIALAKQHPGKIRLLITDMIMPGGMNGYDIFKSIRSANPEIKALVITGYIGGLAADNVLDPDIPILQKPFDSDGLLQKISEILLPKSET
jgi:PAS domain S-box-containing protein